MNTGYYGKPPLRVVNGLSTPTASVVTSTATATATLSKGGAPVAIEGLPTGMPSNAGKIIPAKAPLQTHAEHETDALQAQRPASKPLPEVPPRPAPVIVPSLPTLEKAVAARIYFENLYFAILRKPPSREQRRRAMEKELAVMKLSPEAKQEVRERWTQNETDYLRDRRARVDPSAFVKLKTIGHGMCFF
jgi:protein-serine/threonine kinase